MKQTLLMVSVALLLVGCGFAVGAGQLLYDDRQPANYAERQKLIRVRTQPTVDSDNAYQEKLSCENGISKATHFRVAREGAFPEELPEVEDSPVPITSDVCAKYGLDQQWLAIRAKKAAAKAQKDAAIAEQQRQEAAQEAAREAQRRRIEAQQEKEEKARMKEEEAREKEEEWK